MADEIGEALQRVASASENSNISLEKSASWLATISSITRESASTIGRSLNSVISRYESIKKTGFNEEDATKLNDVVLALSQVGIKATDSQGQLLDFADVLDTVGAKFGSLEKNEKAYIATTLFGTFQRNRGITLLNNYNDSLKNYENALNSAGASEQKFAIYQESSAAKLDKLKTSVEDFWQSTLDSSLIKGTLDALSYLIDAFGNLSTIMVSLVSVLALWKGTQITTTAVLWATSIRTLNVSLADNIRYMIIAKGEALGWTTAQVNAAIATNGLRLAINGLKTAFLSNPLGILAVALTSGILLFDIFKQKQEENAREAEQVAQKLNQEQQALTGLKGEYDKIIQAGNLTAESKSRLKGIQDQLIKTYGIEAKGLDLVNGKYQNQIALINKIVAEKAKEQLASMGTSGEEALAKSTKVSSSQFTAGWFKTNYASEVKQLLDSMVGESLGESTKKKDIFEINGTLEDRVTILKNLKLELDGVANKDAQTITLIKDVTDEYNKLNNELKANQSVLDKYIENKNVVDFYDQFKNNISEVNDLMAKSVENPSDASTSNQLSKLHKNMVDLADSKGRLGDFRTFIDDLFGSSDKAIDASKNINSYEQSFKKLQETMEKSSETIANVKSVLDEYGESGKFNLDNLIKLAKEHESLIPILGDEKAIYKELTNIVQEEQNKSKQAYIAMLEGSTDFYNKNIEGIQALVKGLNGARNADLSGAKTLAEAKLKVELELIKNLASLWSNYYDAQSGAFTGEFENVAGRKVVSGGKNGESTAVSDAMSTQLQAYKEQANKAKQEFDKIALKGTSGIDFSKIGMSKDSKSSKDQIESTTEALLAQINAENKLSAEKAKAIQTSISQAKSDKDHQKELELTTSLIENQKTQLSQLSIARDKINSLKDSAMSSQFGDISRWFTGQDNEKSVAYVEEHNRASEKTREIMEKQFDSLQKLRNAWQDNKNSVSDLTTEIQSLQSSLQDISYSIVTQEIAKFNSTLDQSNSQIELSKARMSLLSDSSSDYSKEIFKQISLYEDLISIQAKEIAYMINQLNSDNLSIEAKKELSKQIEQATISQLNYQKSIKDVSETLAKSVIQAQKAIADANLESQKKALQSQIDYAENELKAFKKVHEANIKNFDNELKAFKTLHESKIESIQSEIDLLEEKNDAEQESIDRAQKLLDIQNAKDKLNNVLNEKNSKVFVEGQGWVFQANPNDVKEATDTLAKLQTDYQQWEKDTALKHQKEMLQNQIKAEQDLIKVKEDSIAKEKEYQQALIDSKQEWYDTLNTQLTNSMTAIQTQFDNQWKNIDAMSDALLAQFGTNVDSAVKVLSDKLANLNTQLAAITNVSLPNNLSNLNSGNTSSVNSSGQAMITYTQGNQTHTVQAGGIFDPSSSSFVGWDTGGLTAAWGSEGKIAKLHEKELVLNKFDTSNILKAVDITRNFMSNFKLPDFSNIKFPSINSGGNSGEAYNFYGGVTIVSDNPTDMFNQLKQRARLK